MFCADPLLAQANHIECPPPLGEMALSLTNYWLFDEVGTPLAWGGQADGDPYHYANMQPTSAAHDWQVSACIGDWTKFYHTTAVTFWWQGEWRELVCYDAFGLESYRQPFFHEGHEQWVIPVDVLTSEPVYGLVDSWETATVPVGGIE